MKNSQSVTVNRPQVPLSLVFVRKLFMLLTLSSSPGPDCPISLIDPCPFTSTQFNQDVFPSRLIQKYYSSIGKNANPLYEDKDSFVQPTSHSVTKKKSGGLSLPCSVRPKTKKGEDELLFICSYVAEKPGGCWEELTCGNVKSHSLFNSCLSTLNQYL